MQQDPMTRVCYEVTTPEGKLYSDTFPLAKLHAEYAAEKHGRSMIVVEEITEIRQVILSIEPAKSDEALHRWTGSQRPKSEPIDSFLMEMRKRDASLRRQPARRIFD